jgi:hypothetical protein
VESDGSIHFGFPKKSKNGARNHQKPGPWVPQNPRSNSPSHDGTKKIGRKA